MAFNWAQNSYFGFRNFSKDSPIAFIVNRGWLNWHSVLNLKDFVVHLDQNLRNLFVVADSNLAFAN